MFREIAITAFIITLVVLALHCIAFPANKKRCWSPVSIFRKIIHLFTLLLLEQKLSFLGVLKKLLFLLALLCFVVLAITGFYPLLVMDKHIYGYFVMVHATFAPVFAICVAVLAIMWARNHRFNRSDWPLLQRIIERVTLRKSPAEEAAEKSVSIAQKITFWLIIFLALPLILSIVSSMFPFFGTYWQEFLLAAHRWTALVFAIIAVIYLYLVIRTQLKQ
jgi:cytochrome b subunit of formate dehydrogenase